MRIKYDKLVRDNIPEIIRGKGGSPITHTADEGEYWVKLKQKLLEETSEFMDAESMEELADVLEVVRAICEYKKYDLKDIETVRAQKAKERGGFKKRTILDES
jgi:predicted house-cleaning noncanonical NTP pyrophosphatase (MazG superfamily)